MKQKAIYSVLLVAAMYLPASSKECAKVFKNSVALNAAPVKEQLPAGMPSLPISPFSRLLFNL